MCLTSCLALIETKPCCVDQTVLELVTLLSLLKAGITGLCRHSQFSVALTWTNVGRVCPSQSRIAGFSNIATVPGQYCCVKIKWETLNIESDFCQTELSFEVSKRWETWGNLALFVLTLLESITFFSQVGLHYSALAALAGSAPPSAISPFLPHLRPWVMSAQPRWVLLSPLIHGKARLFWETKRGNGHVWSGFCDRAGIGRSQTSFHSGFISDWSWLRAQGLLAHFNLKSNSGYNVHAMVVFCSWVQLCFGGFLVYGDYGDAESTCSF